MQLAARTKILSEDLRCDPARPEDWIEARGAVLRELPGRRVFRARAGGLDVVVKEFVPTKLRHRLRLHAELEARRAAAVASRGVPVVEPVAWARLRDGRELLLLREEKGARPLQEIVLEGSARGGRRHELARRVGDLVARMQNAGIRHRDPHAGNILVRPDDTLVLADARQMRPGNDLRPVQRARDLARFAPFFLTHTSRIDQLVFWGAYGRAGRLGPDELEALRGAVAARIPRAFRRLSLKRAARELRHGLPVEVGGFKGVVLGDLPPAALDRIVGRAKALEPGPQVLKMSRTAWTFTEGPDVVAKVYLPKKSTRPLRDLARGTRAERAQKAFHALLHRGFRGPEVLAVLKDGKVPTRSILVMRRVTEARPVEEVFRSLAPARARATARMLGRTLRRLHDWGLRHRDLKKDNLLLTPDGSEVRLLDLDGVRQALRPLDWDRRGRDLANLDGSLFDFTLVPTSLRLRLLQAYVGDEIPPGYSPGAFARRVGELGAATRARRLAANRPTSSR